MDELKCPYCGATTTKNGQAFKNKSSLNTHINIHCEKKPQAESKPTGHSHKWKLLQPTRADYARAMNAGYNKICDCGELA
jgi:hypothetical protein